MERILNLSCFGKSLLRILIKLNPSTFVGAGETKSYSKWVWVERDKGKRSDTERKKEMENTMKKAQGKDIESLL